MNLSLTTQVLASALRTLEKITPAKAVLPILSHVLVRADVGQILLSCTDTELSLTRSCDAQVNAPGRIALPAKALLDIVSQITEPDVHIFQEKNGVRIASGHFKLRLQALDAEQFPVIASSTSAGTLVNGTTLRTLIRKVRTCISASEKRYNINGALLILSDKGILAMVATDGKRLAVASAVVGAIEQPYQTILPTKLLDTLLVDDADDYSFSHTDNQLFFSTEHSVLSSRMVEGTFPNHQRILDNASVNALVVLADRQALSAALKRVSLVAGDSKIVNCSLSANVLQLQGKSVELGDAVENVSVQYDGDPTTISLQAQALIEFLDVAQNPSVTIKLGGPQAAALLLDGHDFLTVAMAVRS